MFIENIYDFTNHQYGSHQQNNPKNARFQQLTVPWILIFPAAPIVTGNSLRESELDRLEALLTFLPSLELLLMEEIRHSPVRGW